jgi:Transglycosylase SLT domain
VILTKKYEEKNIMKSITLVFSILILAFANTAFAQTSKTYLQLSLKEQKQFIAAKVAELSVVKDLSAAKIPDAAIVKIKAFVDGYAKRLSSKKRVDCGFADNLQTVYERAAKNAPVIIEAFNQEKVDPQIGLYLAMIESEHCICLQSPTGPLGLFQLNRKTAEEYGLKVFKDASPSNPDERCDTKSTSIATAKYLNSIAQKFDSVPSRFLYAITIYDSGEASLNMARRLAVSDDIWSVVIDNKKLSKQIKMENFKLIPKFFAAAIIGENPKDFGLKLKPLSTYQK